MIAPSFNSDKTTVNAGDSLINFFLNFSFNKYLYFSKSHLKLYDFE